jgi:hypothetical protein
MDIYDIETRLWSTGTSGGTARDYCKGVVSGGKIYYWGGLVNLSSVNTIDIYDISGDSWSTGTAGGTARSSYVAEVYSGSIYYLSGFSKIVDIYDISGDSWSTGTNGGPTDTSGASSTISGDDIYIWGGQSETYLDGMYKYDISGDSWTTLTSGGTARAGQTMQLYSGKIYVWGGWTGSGTPLDTIDIYDISGDSWSTGTAGGTARKYHDAAYDGSRYWYQHGGLDSNDADLNYLSIFDFSTLTWSTGSNGLLYAALDDGSPTFEEIYDLGEDAGVLTDAVLNDVVVLTEGLDSPPLWWSGCLSDNGSDWTTPLNVLISQDGDNWFDISSDVLTQDEDNYATLGGGVGARGALLVRSPVPRVKGFDIEFHTPNVAVGADTASDLTATFDSSGDITRLDLKGGILYWSQDSEATGHFEGPDINIDAGDAVNYSAPLLYWAGFAYDSTNGDIYVICGDDGSGPYNKTFKYNISSNSWEEVSTSGTPPSVRSQTSLIYDVTNTQLVLFGGSDGSTTEYNDTLMQDVSDNSWTTASPGGTPPSTRYGHCATYDSTLGYMVVMLGFDGTSTYYNDVYRYTLSTDTWTTMTGGGTPPTAKMYAGACIAGDVTWVFGGWDGSVRLQELHKFDLSLDTWTALTPSGSAPAIRFGAAAAYDTVNGYMWVFGGDAVAGKQNDLYYYNVGSNSWNSVSPSGGPPTARSGHDMCYYDGDLYVWGGHDGANTLGDIWKYDISNNTWTELSPISMVGIPSAGHGLSSGDAISISGTTNYDGIQTLQDITSTDEIVISDTYASETFTAGVSDFRLRPTIGAGNDEPDIEEGLTVYTSGGNASILSITDDGEQNGEVTLTSALTSDEVDNIYGLYVDTDGLRPEPYYGAALDTISMSKGNTVTVGKISYRIVVLGSEITYSGNQVRVKLQSGDIAGVGGMEITGVGIVERSGTSDDGTTTPTELTLSDDSIITLRQGGQIAYTNWSDFTVDETKSYLIIVDVDEDCTYNSITRANRISTGSFELTTGGHYYKADVATYNQQTVSGFTERGPWGRPAVASLEVRNRPTISTTQFEAYTDSASIGVGAYDSLLGITIDADEPTGSSLHYGISFDGGQTYRVYLASAWHDITQLDGSDWQYWDGAAWQDATVNTKLGALKQAFLDTDNQMDEAAVEALTETELVGTGRFVAGVTASLDFAFGFTANGTASSIPLLRSITAQVEDAGTTKVKVWQSGAWVDESWTDGTQVGDVPFGQDGQITTSASYSTADYHVIEGAPGYWFKLSFVNGLSSGTAITRVKMSAPCQPLPNIGEGWVQNVLGFVYNDVSINAKRDYTIAVIDDQHLDISSAWLVDDTTDLTSATSMGTSDAFYVGYLTTFNQLQMIVHNIYNNQNTAALSAFYWDGDSWASLTITDGTSVDSKTLGQSGTIAFTAPSDWRQSSLFNEFDRGYWLKFTVDATLSVTGLYEVRVQPMPDSLPKYRYVAPFRNRMGLACRPDALDQVNLSREMEEYGWDGGDTHVERVGGQDIITSAFAAFDTIFICKPQDWYMATVSGNGYRFAHLASIHDSPINARSVIIAPTGKLSQSGAPGAFFLSVNGAYVAIGLHTDLEWGSGQVKKISENVNWWQTDADYRIDLDNLHNCYGAYDKRRNWLLWAVPMRTTSGASEQTTNNRVIVYDLNLGVWYPPMTLSISSICSGFKPLTNAPGGIGESVVYAGDAEGQIWKLFEESDDSGVEIDSYAETGWIGEPSIQKWLSSMSLTGKTSAADEEIDVDLYLDGQISSPYSVTFERQGSSNFTTQDAVYDTTLTNTGYRFIKVKYSSSGPTEIYRLDLGENIQKTYPSTTDDS